MIVDQPLFTRSVTAIRHACSDLSNPTIDRKEVITHFQTNTTIECPRKEYVTNKIVGFFRFAYLLSMS